MPADGFCFTFIKPETLPSPCGTLFPVITSSLSASNIKSNISAFDRSDSPGLQPLLSMKPEQVPPRSNCFTTKRDKIYGGGVSGGVGLLPSCDISKRAGVKFTAGIKFVLCSEHHIQLRTMSICNDLKKKNFHKKVNKLM